MTPNLASSDSRYRSPANIEAASNICAQISVCQPYSDIYNIALRELSGLSAISGRMHMIGRTRAYLQIGGGIVRLIEVDMIDVVTSGDWAKERFGYEAVHASCWPSAAESGKDVAIGLLIESQHATGDMAVPAACFREAIKAAHTPKVADFKLCFAPLDWAPLFNKRRRRHRNTPLVARRRVLPTRRRHNLTKFCLRNKADIIIQEMV